MALMSAISPEDQMKLMQAPASPAFAQVQHPMHAMIAPLGPPPPVDIASMAAGMPDTPDATRMGDRPQVRMASPLERYEDAQGKRMSADLEKDANPYGSPTNHPGFLGKFLHGLSVATGGPNRRQFEEEGLANQLGNEEKEKSALGLQGAQTENLQSEMQHRDNPNITSQTAKWKPLLGGNGQIVTAPGGKIIEVNDAGEVRAQDLPENTSIAPKPTAASGAFGQWSADPTKYENFSKTMAEIKAQVAAEHPHQAANSSFMNVYAAQRFLKMAYDDNPALLPVASTMVGKLLGLTPEQTKVMGNVPLDQPLSPTTGQPIGSKMPSAPTGATRTSAQNAEKFLTEYPRITGDVNSAASDLGPVQGRAVMGFLLGQVGSTGDADADRKLAKLRTDLTFVGSNAAKFHINSVRQAEMFDKLAAQNKSTAPAIQGFLDSIKSWAQTSANQQRGYGEQGNRETGNNSPMGTTSKPDGTYQMDGKTYRVKGGKVYAQ